MGKIIENGVIYGTDNASEINYDNTSSGLSATNVKSAIDEVGTIKDITSQVTKGIAFGALSVTRCGKLVNVNGYPNVNTSTTVTNALTNLPKPITNIHFPLSRDSATTGIGCGLLNTDGNVSLFLSDSANGSRFNFSYFTNN